MLCPGFVLKSASVTAQQNDRRLDARTLTRTVLELIAPCKASLSLTLSLTPISVTVSAGQSFELNVLFSARDRLKAVCVSVAAVYGQKSLLGGFSTKRLPKSYLKLHLY